VVGRGGFTPAALIMLTAEPQIGEILGSKELKFYFVGIQIKQAHFDVLLRQG
jgi:hypothetical protein